MWVAILSGVTSEAAMKRAFLCILGILAALGMSVTGMAQNASALHYGVDASTAEPPATVVTHSNGVTVVIFRVDAIHDGDSFTFFLNVSCPSSKPAYPVDVPLAMKGNGKLTAFFNPSHVTLQTANHVSTTAVTVTVASAGDKKKLKGDIKGTPPHGSHLGQGPGVKVIVTTKAANASADPEQQVLDDVTEALTPDAPPERQ